MTRAFHRLTILVVAAAFSAGVANAGPYPYSGAASDAVDRSKSRATTDMTERICIVVYDAHPSATGRRRLSSARCPVYAALNKQDPCFCVVDIEGQPYAAAGKVAFVVPGGGYSW